MSKYVGLVLIPLFVSSCAFPAKYPSYIPTGNIVVDDINEYPFAWHNNTTFGRFGVAARNFDKLAIILIYSPKPNVQIKLDKNYILIKKCGDEAYKEVLIPYLTSKSIYYIETQSVIIGKLEKEITRNNQIVDYGLYQANLFDVYDSIPNCFKLKIPNIIILERNEILSFGELTFDLEENWHIEYLTIGL